MSFTRKRVIVGRSTGDPSVRNKKPPDNPIQSVQYDLFVNFVANDESQVSNTIEFWDSIPKYFFTPKQVAKLRTADGLAHVYKYDYVYNGHTCTVKIQPAQIEQEDGSYKAFFPSVTEELVEEALKKILTDQQYGIHDPKKIETWVRFSLRMIQRELKKRGKTRSIPQIKHAIEVMSTSIINLSIEGEELWRGAILQDLVTVNRKEYIADSSSHHYCRLPLFVTEGINKLDYRQFNYHRLMSCNEQLTRWLYKKLINRFKNASLANDYHFMYSNMAQESGLLQQARAVDNRRKVKNALSELIKINILIDYTAESIKEGRLITDVKYTVTPTIDFVGEQKAANKRMSQNQVEASAKRIKS